MAKTKITWTIKSKIISFLLTTQYLKEYDCMTPAQVAHKSATLIEKILESDLPPLLALSNELQKTIKED